MKSIIKKGWDNIDGIQNLISASYGFGLAFLGGFYLMASYKRPDLPGSFGMYVVGGLFVGVIGALHVLATSSIKQFVDGIRKKEEGSKEEQNESESDISDNFGTPDEEFQTFE
jgi:hypothetical protein